MFCGLLKWKLWLKLLLCYISVDINYVQMKKKIEILCHKNDRLTEQKFPPFSFPFVGHHECAYYFI